MDSEIDYSFERLLRALQSEKKDLVGALASGIFITRRGEANKVEIDAFSSYAECKIETQYIESQQQIVGTIYYQGKKYFFG
jgi:hypothetical protein